MGRYHKPEIPPVLLGEVRKLGIMLNISCAMCLHSSKIDPKTLRYGDDVALQDLVPFARCTDCGRKRGGMNVSVDLKPWVAHLRATGQEDRIPYVVRGLM